MTAQQLFDLTANIMGITPANATSYSDVVVGQINAILAQTFSLENNNRQFAGLTELTTIPTVASLGDALTYQDNVLRNVVSWGLAQLLALSDDDTIKAGFFETRYADGYAKERKLIVTDPTDYYSTEGE